MVIPLDSDVMKVARTKDIRIDLAVQPFAPRVVLRLVASPLDTISKWNQPTRYN